jgi:lipopolysaccharide/colanic/teichoic acid biosynthesis glycosyltransferase
MELKQGQWWLLGVVLLAGDAAGILAASRLATPLVRWLIGDPHIPTDQTVVLLIMALNLIGFQAHGLYEPRHTVTWLQQVLGVLRGAASASVALILIGFVFYAAPPRAWTAATLTIAVLLVATIRLAIRLVTIRLRRKGFFVDRVLLVGGGQQGIGIARQLSRPEAGIEIVGVLDDYAAPGSVLGNQFKVLGTSADLARIGSETGAHETIVVPDALPWETLQTVLTEAAIGPTAPRVHLTAGFHHLLTTGVQVTERNHVPLLTLKKVALTRTEAAIKMAMDWVVAVFVLAACCPAILLIVMRLRARGFRSVLQRQTVVGRYESDFEMISFRPEASRSTFIRRLPQLINVLRGEMSVVGPRPLRLDEFGDPTRVRQRPRIRPGLTGLWRQVTSPGDQAIVDLYYVRNYSVGMDLQILLTRLLTRVPPWRGREIRPGFFEERPSVAASR